MNDLYKMVCRRLPLYLILYVVYNVYVYIACFKHNFLLQCHYCTHTYIHITFQFIIWQWNYSERKHGHLKKNNYTLFNLRSLIITVGKSKFLSYPDIGTLLQIELILSDSVVDSKNLQCWYSKLQRQNPSVAFSQELHPRLKIQQLLCQ